MNRPIITSALTKAGIQLLKTLVEHSQNYGELLDSTIHVILEHWLQSVLDEEALRSAFDRAQTRFSGYAEAHERWLEVFDELLEYAGDERLSFAENLWRAYLFRAQGAAEYLWDQYPDIQRTVSIETGRYLPRSWGEWILPMQTFMGIAEQCLVSENDIFEDVFASEDLLNIIEDLPLGVEEDGDEEVFHAEAVPIEPGDIYDDTTLIAYLNACIEDIGAIDPRGYPRSVHTTVPLSDVYIPVRLVSLTDYDQPVHYVRYQSAFYDDPEHYTFHNPLGYREFEDHDGQRVSEVLARNPLLLILGQSGTGKTTLLRHLVLEHANILLDDQARGLDPAARGDGKVRFKLARPLPIYVDLATYVEDSETDEPLAQYVLRTADDIVRDEGIASLLDTLLEHGQCLLLLDGLDQVATDEQRRQLVARVAEATETWQEAGNRVVVSSRFAGYDIAPLPRDFATYIIRPLDRSQINAFLLRWKLTLDRMQRPLMGDDQAKKQAHLDTLELSRQITTNPRLYALVNTPLLLRMLVAVYRPQMQLSPQKAAVYQHIVDTLLREWRLPHSASREPAVLHHEATTLLSELAFWLQSSRPTGLVAEEELQRILGRIWGRMHPDASVSDIRTAVGGFLGTLRMYSGVLIELAPKQYGFIYHGLQEYFAARYLVSSYRSAPQRIRKHLHDPRWNEVIMLAIGLKSLTSPEDASDLIRSAVLARGERAAQFGHASSPFESALKRDLLFAARLLGTGVEISTDIGSRIVSQLVDLWLHGDRDSLGRFSLIYDSARRHLIYLDGTSASRLALQIVLDHLDDPDERVRAYAVDALTFWPSHMAEAQEALIDAVREKQPLVVRRAVARALGRMNSLSKEAYGLLLDLTADIDETVCKIAQDVLEDAAPVPYEALSLWVEFLHSADPIRQRVSLRRLQQVGSLPAQVIGELLRLLGEQDPAIRKRAVDTLSSVGNLPDDALTAICRTIQDAEPTFKAAAIGAFARPVELPEQVIEQLIRWSEDPDVGVRRAAIEALSACKCEDDAVLAALIERLNDPSDSIRAAVIEPIVLKGKESGPALHMLTHIARDTIYQVRRAVAHSLRHIPQPDEDLQETLYQLLSDREMIVRETTLETIRHLDDPGDEIIDYLISLGRMPEHPLRSHAVQALAGLEDLPDRALLALMQSLPAFTETLGSEIVDTMRRHMPLSGTVLNEAMDLAVLRDGRSHQSTSLRALALDILGYALKDAPSSVLQILLEAANESERVRVRVAALNGMAHASFMSPTMLETLTTLQQYAPFEVRCAAGVTLGKLIRNLPDPLLEGKELLEIARELAAILIDLPARAAWEPETQTQNEVLRALSWVVSRARPTVPKLSARSEDPRSYLDQ